LTIHIENETQTERIERRDHEGTTGSLNGLSSVSVCRRWLTPEFLGDDRHEVGRLVEVRLQRLPVGFFLVGAILRPADERRSLECDPGGEGDHDERDHRE